MGLSAAEQLDRYRDLAGTALEHYAVGNATPTFIGHNAGVSYRVDAAEGDQQFLLKIAEPIGESERARPRTIRSGLVWLAAIARETDLVVQEPIPNRNGELLTEVRFHDLPEPFYCSLQRWIDGEHVRGDLTVLQAYRVGKMIARMHQHAGHWQRPEGLDGTELDEAWLMERLQALRPVVADGILSEKQWSAVEEAGRSIREVMERLGREPEVWGLVHGDIHHDNLLFHADDVRPIDFGALRLAHFLYDLGVVLYHNMYLEDPAVRRAIIDGYKDVRELGEPVLAMEAFVCAAAISNLTFQITIPSERTSSLFRRNVREFAGVFCDRLAGGEPFVLCCFDVAAVGGRDRVQGGAAGARSPR